MHLNAYLHFDGDCEAAFIFYQKCLGGEIVAMIRNSDTPMADQTPPDRLGKIMHARLIVDGQFLMGADAPTQVYQKPAGFSLTVGVDTPEDADRVFNALVEGGAVRMPLQETFWATRFGMLVDRFGIAWMVNCEKAE